MLGTGMCIRRSLSAVVGLGHCVRGLGVRCASHFRRNVKMSFCFVV
jgi:thermostable 8-oxoguanine DNA glycosylase